MPRRRWLATLASLFLLQLVFVESGYACAMPTMAAGNVTSMAGMPMPATHAAQAPHAPTDGKAPCRFPWAPDGCQSMAPCAPAALTVPTPALTPAPQLVAAVPARTVRTPPSETPPPELPPPRV